MTASSLTRANPRSWYRAIWKVLSVNPASRQDFDLYDPAVYRRPAPGSQGQYVRPHSAASNIFKNYYFMRDQRRNDLGKPVLLTGQQPSLSAAASDAAPAQVAVPQPALPSPGKGSGMQTSDYSYYRGPRLGSLKM